MTGGGAITVVDSASDRRAVDAASFRAAADLSSLAAGVTLKCVPHEKSGMAEIITELICFPFIKILPAS